MVSQAFFGIPKVRNMAKSTALGEAKEALLKQDFDKLLRANRLFKDRVIETGNGSNYLKHENLLNQDIQGLFKLWYETRGQFIIYAELESNKENPQLIL
jgi:hypothetical protein